jgi:hypothetical protein
MHSTVPLQTALPRVTHITAHLPTRIADNLCVLVCLCALDKVRQAHTVHP